MSRDSLSVAVGRAARVGAQHMPRAARQAATEALSRLGQSSAPDLGSDDDGETESDDGEEAQEEEQLATEPLPLTEYELQRQRNIAANQSVLESLGLAGKTPLGAAASSSSQRARKTPQAAAAAKAARAARAAKVANRKQPRRGVNAEPDHEPNATSEDEDEDDEDDDDSRSDASTASTTPSRHRKRQAGAADSPAAVELDAAQRRRAAARFRWLRGESAGATAAEPPPSARLTRPQLALALSSLGLDVGERDVSDMLSCFDSGGGGGEGLSFADFLRLVQQLPSSVLD